MASKQAKVRCPHCSVEFGFGLPEKYVERPTKNLKFICEYCTEKFSVFVSDLFSEDGTELAALKIRHQSINGLQLYSSWEEALQSHFDLPIEDSDPISAFGKEWKPASMFGELSVIFPQAEISDAIEEEPVEKKEEIAEEAIVEVEEEPSYEDDLFMDKPVQDDAWKEDVEDPFDIPISNISDDMEEDEEMLDLIAAGAMDSFLEESEENPQESAEEESEDPFLAISDEIEIQRDHSIDALISTLDTELEKTDSLGTNTLELLQSEEVEPVSDAPPPEVEVEWDEEESVEEAISKPEEIVVDDDDEDLETMKTVIDSSPFQSLGLESEDTIHSSAIEDDFVLAPATLVSEEESIEKEDSIEEELDQTQTIVSTSTSSWGQEEHAIEPELEFEEDNAEDLSFFTPDSWDEEEVEESNNGSESIDYDQTEEEESQSALNPAFQINTKKVVRKQYWAVASVAALALVAAVLIVRYSSISDVRGFFMPIEELETESVEPQNKTAKKPQEKPKETMTQVATKTEKKVSEKPVETQEKPLKKEQVPKVVEEKKEMLTAVPQKNSFINDKPLSKTKKEKKLQRRKELPKLPPMDPKRATREGWIKLEDKSYESAKAIFEDVIKNEPTPEAFLGLGFAEERMADRFKDRKDFIRVEAHYDQAHKYYCEAMEYYERGDIVKEELRFGINYLRARLKVISRACI